MVPMNFDDLDPLEKQEVKLAKTCKKEIKKGDAFFRCSYADCEYAGDYLKSEAPHYDVNQELMTKVDKDEAEKLDPKERICFKSGKHIQPDNVHESKVEGDKRIFYNSVTGATHRLNKEDKKKIE